MSQASNLGKQALEKAAELAVTSQIEQAEQVTVDVHLNPLQLLQGKLEAVTIRGEGIVVEPDLQATAIDLETDAIAIDPIKAILGQVELSDSLTVRMRVQLTEADLNQAANSIPLRHKLRSLLQPLPPSTIRIGQVKLQLPQPGQIQVQAQLQLPAAQSRTVTVTIRPSLTDTGDRIGLDVLAVETPGLPLDQLQGLIQQILTFSDLRNLKLDNLQIRLTGLEVQVGQLLLQARLTVQPAG